MALISYLDKLYIYDSESGAIPSLYESILTILLNK